MDFNLSKLIDKHIFKKALITLALNKDDQKFNNSKLKYLTSETEISLFGLNNDKNKKASNFKQLVYHNTIFDDNSEEDKIKINKKVFNHYDNFDLVYNFEDIHFYLFNKAIFSLLEDEKIKTLNLIKTNFIPFLINHSYDRRLTNLVKNFKTYAQTEEEGENQVINLELSNKKLKTLKIFGYFIENKDYAL